jgi:hypothetical protein
MFEFEVGIIGFTLTALMVWNRLKLLVAQPAEQTCADAVESMQWVLQKLRSSWRDHDAKASWYVKPDSKLCFVSSEPPNVQRHMARR